MTKRRILAGDVFQVGVERMIELYRSGHRIVIAFSAGKDSGVCVELARIAAKETDYGPVEVCMVDDEIMYPGTFEYAERIMNLPDVSFSWLTSRQPIPNVYNRREPYFWVFDPLLSESEWVRPIPSWCEITPIIDLFMVIDPSRFPPARGKKLVTVIGIRTSESKNRLLGIHSAKGFISVPDPRGVRKAYPIYDWSTGDVWKAIQDNDWDYNQAYDILLKMGMGREKQRVAPPTMNLYGAEGLRIAARTWPRWFDKVCDRLPGVRQVALFGELAVRPIRKQGESWHDCFIRTCIEDAPEWIRNRSIQAMNNQLERHSAHSTQSFPEAESCHACGGSATGSWEGLANIMYTGDPYSSKASFLPYVQAQEFRPDDLRIWESRPGEGR